MRLFCLVLGHRPNKTRVWNDNVDFRAPCINCGAPMLRDANKMWRVFDQDKDALPNRKQHRREKAVEP